MKNMPKKYSLEVTNQRGRLDKFISEQLSDLSRTRVKELIQDQNILVNEKVEKVSYKIQDGDKIEITPVIKETARTISTISPQIMFIKSFGP